MREHGTMPGRAQPIIIIKKRKRGHRTAITVGHGRWLMPTL